MILYVENGFNGRTAEKTLIEHNGANVYVRYNPDYTYIKADEEKVDDDEEEE